MYETSVLPLLTTLLDGYNVTGTVIHIGSGAVLRSRSLFCRLQLKKSIISTFLTTPQPSSLKNAFIFQDLFFNLPLINVGIKKEKSVQIFLNFLSKL